MTPEPSISASEAILRLGDFSIKGADAAETVAPIFDYFNSREFARGLAGIVLQNPELASAESSFTRRLAGAAVINALRHGNPVTVDGRAEFLENVFAAKRRIERSVAELASTQIGKDPVILTPSELREYKAAADLATNFGANLYVYYEAVLSAADLGTGRALTNVQQGALLERVVLAIEEPPVIDAMINQEAFQLAVDVFARLVEGFPDRKSQSAMLTIRAEEIIRIAADSDGYDESGKRIVGLLDDLPRFSSKNKARPSFAAAIMSTPGAIELACTLAA
jgi:hypothetical protein